MDTENRQVNRATRRELEKLVKKKKYSELDSFDNFPLSKIEEFSNRIDWDQISSLYNLSDNFLNNFKHKINWKKLSQNSKQQIPDNLFEEFIEQIDVGLLMSMNKIPTRLVRKFSKYILYKLSRKSKDGGLYNYWFGRIYSKKNYIN